MLPNLSDYMQTFQNPSLFLSDRGLTSCTCPKDQQGQPRVQSGGFALTFRLESSTQKWAVRCFHREVKDRDKRYTAISAMLNKAVMKQSGYFVDFAYQAKGVMVKGQWYPIVKMSWAHGETLGAFLESNYNDRQAMLNLKASLQKLYKFLSSNHVAHGDIQPGNLMVSNNGLQVQLIDYDGMYVPGMQNLSASETGVPNFQHPSRQSENPWNERLDRFPFIMLDIALTVIAERPEYWTKTQSSDEKVLFETTDYMAPYGSKILNELKADSRFSQQISVLQQICSCDFDSIPEADKYLLFRPSTTAATKKQPSTVTVSYKGNFPVFDATDIRLIARNVGSVVELVGKIVETKENTTAGRGRFGGRPYMFVNFTHWRPRTDTVRLVFWSEVLDQFHKMGVQLVSSRFRNHYVSVTGMICEFTNNFGSSYQLIPTSAKQVLIIDKEEADFRLGKIQRTLQQKFGGTVAAPTTTAGGSNVDKLKGIGGKAPSIGAPLSPIPVRSGRRPAQKSPPPPPRPISNVERLRGLTQRGGGGRTTPPPRVRQFPGPSKPSSPPPLSTPSSPTPARPNPTGSGCCLWLIALITIITLIGKMC